MKTETIKEIEKIIKYNFGDKNLLAKAFTHSSFSTKNNERLEFLGDSVLQVVVTKILFLEYGDVAEGKLSVIRTRIVDEKNLSDTIDKLLLSKYIVLGKSFKNKPSRSMKADLCEAILGAIFIDSKCKLEEVEGFIRDFVELDYEFELDYKTRLQEYVQSVGVDRIVYNTREFPNNSSSFECLLFYKGQNIAVASGVNKKLAEQKAACIAYKYIKNEE